MSHLYILIFSVSNFCFAFSILAVFKWYLYAGASCTGAAAPSSGEVYRRAVQPAAAADQRRTECWPAEGRKLRGEVQMNSDTVGFLFKGMTLIMNIYYTRAPACQSRETNKLGSWAGTDPEEGSVSANSGDSSPISDLNEPNKSVCSMKAAKFTQSNWFELETGSDLVLAIL